MEPCLRILSVLHPDWMALLGSGPNSKKIVQNFQLRIVYTIFLVCLLLSKKKQQTFQGFTNQPTKRRISLSSPSTKAATTTTQKCYIFS